MLKAGDKAPDFRLKTDEGTTLSLADFRGRRVVLFFFPESQHFRLNNRSVRVS